MQYLTADTYAQKLVTVPDGQVDNYLLACRLTEDNPMQWYNTALETEIAGPQRQSRIAKLNQAKAALDSDASGGS